VIRLIPLERNFMLRLVPLASSYFTIMLKANVNANLTGKPVSTDTKFDKGILSFCILHKNTDIHHLILPYRIFRINYSKII
jgi:hypothetical protein